MTPGRLLWLNLCYHWRGNFALLAENVSRWMTEVHDPRYPRIEDVLADQDRKNREDAPEGVKTAAISALARS